MNTATNPEKYSQRPPTARPPASRSTGLFRYLVFFFLPAGPLAASTELDLPDTWDMDPEDLVRVDVPDFPDALTTSSRGSLLAAPPDDGTPWRVASVAELDEFQAWEAADAMQVDAWHQAGYTGMGVKVAIFDMQYFDTGLNIEELGDFETHDCYVHPQCTVPIDPLRPAFSFEEGVHGLACAEIIRDMAPDAELHLVRVSTTTTLENAIEWAVREGIDLVSMSLSFFNESFYDGTGPVNELMPDMAAGDVLMVTSAGNYAEEHWVEDFKDLDLDGYHEFPWGTQYLPIYLGGGGRSSIYVNWDQYGFCGETDLDVLVYRSDGVLAGRSEERQDPESNNCEPVERVSAWAEDSGWYYLQVRRAAGDPVVRFSVMAKSGEIYQAMPNGSITDPGTHALAFTVGAVRADGYLGNGAEYFSSQGPTHGGLAKPDIAGPDGLSTASYGMTSFYGTSASTPAVTGALALIMDRYPDMGPYDAAMALQDWAVSDSATWDAPDMALGAGYARLPALESSLHGCGGRPLMMWIPLLLPFAGIRRRIRRELEQR